MTTYAMINEVLVPANDAVLHVSDLSIQRGYGVFDFFKVISGKPCFLQEHLRRLYHSASQMHLDAGISIENMEERVHRLVQANGLAESGVRITLTGGYSPDGFTPASPNMIITELPLVLPRALDEKGITLMSYNYQRPLAEIKTIDYQVAIWLQPQLRSKQANDILYHQDGWVRECPRSNIFIVTRDQELLTPSDKVLKGITRQQVLDLARGLGNVRERAVSLQELLAAEEVFITSTTKHLLPVTNVDGQVIGNGQPGPLTRQLFERFQQRVFPTANGPIA